MKSPRYARLVAEVYKRVEPRAREFPSSSHRDEQIALIEQAMDRKRRESRRMRLAARWSAAAVITFFGFGAFRLLNGRVAHPLSLTSPAAMATGGDPAPPVAIAIASGGGAIVATPGSSTPAVVGRALQAGSRLIVDPNAGATLALSTGTHLAVEPGSQLAVIGDGRAQIFALTAGSLRADVAKLASSERFIVRTLDAEVEVRGTSFLVDVVPSDPECGAGTTTRVTVYEGLVAVRVGGRDDAVQAGEHWPRGCRTPVLSANATKHAAKSEGRSPSVARAVKSTDSELATQPPAPAAATSSRAAVVPSPTGQAFSHLSEENDLFAEGIRARRSGNLPLALDRMERLLSAFPASHLAENASAERMHLLRILDPAKALGAAKQYLQRYPAGFAHAEAEAIVAGTR